MLILAGSFIWVLRPAAPLVHWREFSPGQFQAELGHKAMLLEFTADSCPNCKVLEATVLTDERMRKLRARYGMELIRVDRRASMPMASVCWRPWAARASR